MIIVCPRCNGNKLIPEQDSEHRSSKVCNRCHGIGKVTSKKKLITGIKTPMTKEEVIRGKDFYRKRIEKDTEYLDRKNKSEAQVLASRRYDKRRSATPGRRAYMKKYIREYMREYYKRKKGQIAT